MQIFELTLPDGTVVSGRHSFPPEPKARDYLPLVVCIAGGSYDAGYFDVDANHSISSVSSCFGVPVISLDRPGYGSSTVVPAGAGDDESYAQRQGKILNSTILPSLWGEFGKRCGAAAIVLLAHSIGAMVATIAAGSYTGTDRDGYPLAGLINSGIGTELAAGPRQAMLQLLQDTTDSAYLDPPAKDAIMLQWPIRNVVDPVVCQYTEKLNKPVPRDELLEINTTWLGYWIRYSNHVTVPLMYGLSEFDGLWVSTENTIEEYRSAFPASPKVSCEMIPMAPHCIELSCQGKAWYLKCCGFALECAVSHGLKNDLHDKSNARPEESSGGVTTITYTTTTRN